MKPTSLKDSESANQDEPNLIRAAEIWAATKQTEDRDVTG